MYLTCASGGTSIPHASHVCVTRSEDVGLRVEVGIGVAKEEEVGVPNGLVVDAGVGEEVGEGKGEGVGEGVGVGVGSGLDVKA